MSVRMPVALCAICLGIGLLGVLGDAVPLLSFAEDNLGLHLLYRLRGAERPETGVVIVAIDRESAKALNLPTAPHKWPRHLHARLLDRLRAQRAAVVAFDLIFQDPTQPREDAAFASAIESAGNVILTQPIDHEAMPLFDENNLPVSRVNIQKRISAIPILADAALAQAPFPLPKVPVTLNQYWRFSPGLGDMPTLPVVVMHVYAMDAFGQFLALLGQVDPLSAAKLPFAEAGETDTRRMVETIRPLFLLFKKDATLAGRMMDALEQDASPSLSSEATQRIKAFIRLYGSANSSYFNFYGPPRTIETLSYHKLLESVESETGRHNNNGWFLNGKAVFVGQTESDWFKANDGFYTAFTEDTGMDISGVEVAATAFANMLEAKEVRPFGLWGHHGILLGWGVFTGLVALCFSTLTSTISMILINGAYLGLAHIQFKSGGIWYPLVIPMLVQTPTAYMAGLAWKYRKANKERKNIRQAFGYYLPNEVVKRLAADAKAVRGGGQVLYSICLFTDAEQYTTLSERMDPESLTHLMNSYYEAIFKPIKDNGGLILQVIGDSVLAMWTAPQPRIELNAAACRAALGIADAVQRFNATAGSNRLPTRIGMHAGKVLLGNIGALDHFEYRPVGDIVNTASRLEGLNKYLGTYVLASQDVWPKENGYIMRPVGRFMFKGKSQPVRVKELISDEIKATGTKTSLNRNFSLGLEAYEQQQWDTADAFFGRALKIDSQDGPSKFYRELCRSYRESPPDSPWDGTVYLTKK